MAILDIIEAPHPILSATARPVREDEFGPELERRLADMAETMYAAPGVGLAAPQVSDGRRLIVVDPGNEKEEHGGLPERELIAMVNPELVEHGDQTIVWEESCLSVPDMYVDVKRHKSIRVRWRDGAGQTHERDFQEFPAVVVQHEIDHLQGTTLFDRASALKRRRYLSRKKKRDRARL